MDEDSEGRSPSPRVPVLLATPTTNAGTVCATPQARTPSTSPGDGFRWEAEMTAPAVAQIGRLLPRARIPHVVVGETPAAVGVADIVAVCFDPAAIECRLRNGLGPICSPLRVRTLDALRDRRSQRVRTVAHKVGSNPAALTRSTLGPLTELGAVELSGELVRSTGVWRPVGSQLTAVELKLSKWRHALRQADNLALSADRAWVVLDETRAAGALAAADRFREFGVGLAVLTCEGKLRIVVRPKGCRAERWLRALLAEHAWAIAESEVSAIVEKELNQFSPAL